MSDTRVTVRKVVLGGGLGLASGSIGAFLGANLVKGVAHGSKGAPAWELPLIVVGPIALAVIGALIWVSISDRDAHVRQKGGD